MSQVKLPKFLRDFLIYLTTITGKSPRTRKEYEYDLLLFLRFTKAMEQDMPLTNLHTIDISDVTIENIKEMTLEDLYLFMEYCEVQRGNSATSRARKVATLKAFFKYLKAKRRLIDENPAEALETPKIGKRQPVYLNMEEAKIFIHAVESQHYSHRDYCMMVFFLNLGIRVSELCSLDLASIHDRKMTVIGKGNKERQVYLNDSCMKAMESYLLERNIYKGEGPQPLFVSQKGTRFARQTIAKIVKQINLNSSIPKDKLTPHKLRHTSATMMYKAGADIRSLQHILGHSSVATTQIYTHIEDEQIQEVLKNNPFNNLA
ncbi:recombinase XerC [Lysinibacillus sp. 2017]|uniref:tyrosine recombinase XerC n=1 Tax=unclassified Lysinibacillus TaxID=2636778 RepID=UPI000D528EC0|nr:MULTISPECIES: tyrosine recombinase XerC [unclassified Lysinibacillus]AWE07498.1 recombinase XerC [Lysinibacillus sp. 2017]TGN36660.1 tyrosine recombinase XerC [Lysinibacillus sp. S2017]